MSDPLTALSQILGGFKIVRDLIGQDKQFYPMPKLALYPGSYKDASTGQSVFYVRITNLHHNLHILSPKASVSFANPFRGWRLWKQSWIPYVEDRLPDIGPGETKDHLNLEKNGSIENFVDKTFGGRFIREIPKNPVNQFCYQVVEEKSWRVRLRLTYGSSVVETKRRDFVKDYLVTPIDGAPEKWVTNWNIEEIEAR